MVLNKAELILITISGCFLFSVFSSAYASDYPMAGLKPWQRPQGTPVIEWVRHNRLWYQHALTGISRPYPRSLYFLDNQGNWYTPFIHPGMTGKYDIRKWHKQKF